MLKKPAILMNPQFEKPQFVRYTCMMIIPFLRQKDLTIILQILQQCD